MNKYRKRYLAIGPLPPPVGGDTVSFSRLVNSEVLKANNIILDVLDTSRKEEGKRRKRLDIRDVLNTIRIIIKTFRARKKVDGVLIWANSRFSYTVGLIIILLFHSINKKVILKLFGTSFEEHYNKLPKFYKKIIVKQFSKINYILPQTKGLYQFFYKIGLNKNNIIQFPNFLNDEVNLKNNFPKLENEIKCIYVGRLIKEKGIFDILKVLEKNHTITCDFYGPIFEKDKKLFKKQVGKIPNAKYMNVIPANKVIDTISDYHFLILPSYYMGEGYPGVVIEAFFANRPVVVTNWKSLPEIVENNLNGFIVNTNSPEEIEGVLTSLKTRENSYENMCYYARETAKKYTEESVVGKILVPLLK